MRWCVILAWKISVTAEAGKSLGRLDPSISKRIAAFIRELGSLSDPRLRGKALTGNRAGFWRYRVGNYRIIARIMEQELCVVIVSISHRRDIYQTR
ncbi:type II toxin-antitoxin system RelE family toxin [Actinotignum schaalii]|uniref:type II toxin-antitoxin system RelE family toxin n=1 Tax=Actinotignum schaalii TaxID=59505 RepID=UPI00191BD07D|nr:type II toxin-antitoxin system RelE/ParE family toxin [Actinotignum schaalii]WQN45620.1 type II toxin-antitoxin system RelE/ParE family toxin [Actinotignum schaalii]